MDTPQKATVTYEPLSDDALDFLADARKGFDSMRAVLEERGVLPKGASIVQVVQGVVDESLLRAEDLGPQEALGFALGEEAARILGYEWQIVTDPWGTTLGLVHPTKTNVAFALDWMKKRYQSGPPRGLDVEALFEALVAAITEAEKRCGPRTDR